MSYSGSHYTRTDDVRQDSVRLVNILGLHGVLLGQPASLVFQYRLVREGAVLSLLSPQLPVRDLDGKFLRETVLVELRLVVIQLQPTDPGEEVGDDPGDVNNSYK